MPTLEEFDKELLVSKGLDPDRYIINDDNVIVPKRATAHPKEESSALEAGAKAFRNNLGPVLGGLGAATAVGAATGGLGFIPSLIATTAAGVGGSMAGNKLQEMAAGKEEGKEFKGNAILSSDEERARLAEEHPVATFIGGNVPMLLGGKPSLSQFKNLSTAGKALVAASPLTKVEQHALGNLAANTAVQGYGTAERVLSGQKVNPLEEAANLAFATSLGPWKGANAPVKREFIKPGEAAETITIGGEKPAEDAEWLGKKVSEANVEGALDLKRKQAEYDAAMAEERAAQQKFVDEANKTGAQEAKQQKAEYETAKEFGRKKYTDKFKQLLEEQDRLNKIAEGAVAEESAAPVKAEETYQETTLKGYQDLLSRIESQQRDVDASIAKLQKTAPEKLPGQGLSGMQVPSREAANAPVTSESFQKRAAELQAAKNKAQSEYAQIMGSPEEVAAARKRLDDTLALIEQQQTELQKGLQKLEKDAPDPLTGQGVSGKTVQSMYEKLQPAASPELQELLNMSKQLRAKKAELQQLVNENATPKVEVPEVVPAQPESGVVSGKTPEAGVGDSVQRQAEGVKGPVEAAPEVKYSGAEPFPEGTTVGRKGKSGTREALLGHFVKQGGRAQEFEGPLYSTEGDVTQRRGKWGRGMGIEVNKEFASDTGHEIVHDVIDKNADIGQRLIDNPEVQAAAKAAGLDVHEYIAEAGADRLMQRYEAGDTLGLKDAWNTLKYHMGSKNPEVLMRVLENRFIYEPQVGGGELTAGKSGGKGILDPSAGGKYSAQNQFSGVRTIQRDIGENKDFAAPPTDEEAVKALYDTKKSQFGAARKLDEGTPVDLRIDIPAYKNTGKYVVTVHEPDTVKGGPGTVIGYDTVGRVKNPRFVVKNSVIDIATGKANKFPVATVHGDFVNSREIPADLENWTAVGMDPKEHEFFYDKRTDRPVVSGDEAVSVGNTVFVKNPVYGETANYRYSGATGSALDAIKKQSPEAMDAAEKMWNERSRLRGELGGDVINKLQKFNIATVANVMAKHQDVYRNGTTHTLVGDEAKISKILQDHWNNVEKLQHASGYPRPINGSGFYVPEMISNDVRALLDKGIHDSKVREIVDTIADHWIKGGMDPAEAPKNAEDYVIGLSGARFGKVGLPAREGFDPLRVAAGLGLPEKTASGIPIRETDPLRTLQRYGDQAATDMAYQKEVASKLDQKLLDSLRTQSEGPWQIMENLYWNQDKVNLPTLRAANKLITTSVLGPISKTVEVLTNPQNAMAFGAGFGDVAKAIKRVSGDFTKQYDKAVKGGIVTPRSAGEENFGQIYGGGTPVKIMNKVSDFISTYTGTKFLEETSRVLSYSLGEATAETRKANGDAKWFKERGVNINDPQAVQKAASQMAEMIQGRRDARELPAVMLKGPLAEIAPIHRWAVGHSANLVKEMQQGNYSNFVGYMAAGLGVALAREELNKFIKGREGNAPTMKELEVAGYPTAKTAAAVTDMLRSAGIGGALVDITNYGLKKAGNQNAQLIYNPLASAVQTSLLDAVPQFAEAVNAGVPPVEVAEILGKNILRSLSQVGAVAMDLSQSKEEQQANSRARNFRTFQSLVEDKPAFSGTGNPALMEENRKFARTTDPEEMDRMIDILSRRGKGISTPRNYMAPADPLERMRYMRYLEATGENEPGLEEDIYKQDVANMFKRAAIAGRGLTPKNKRLQEIMAEMQ